MQSVCTELARVIGVLLSSQLFEQFWKYTARCSILILGNLGEKLPDEHRIWLQM
jgi:hypothetical protein